MLHQFLREENQCEAEAFMTLYRRKREQGFYRTPQNHGEENDD